MSIDVKKKLKKERARSYLARDFNSFRAELIRYAQTYFPDKINDFSDASVGGLFLDMVAMVGDNMSFYLDHQFNELQWDTAVESKNIIRHIKNAGIKISGKSPAVADVEFSIEVPAELVGDAYAPKESSLPVILEETTVVGDGITFNLTEDIDFAERNQHGELYANVVIGSVDPDSGNPLTFIISKTEVCISGTETTESFLIGDSHVPFRTITLLNSDVTQVISVEDSDANIYYEVESLAQDTVYKGIINLDVDEELVEKNLEVIPAPYRFIRSVNPNTRMTTIQFGSGDAESLDDDIIPDPSELSMPLYGRNTISRFSLDPNALLQTHTLGVAPRGTRLTIKYRHGGGLRHNLSSGALKGLGFLKMAWRAGTPAAGEKDAIKSSLIVTNKAPASGGEIAATLNDLRKQIPAARQMQSRIVTKQDLLSRIYTMPSKFGRVFRAGIRDNPNNPLSTHLFIISRDKDKKLVISPDALKKNLRLYLNEYRLISDALDVVDAPVINFKVNFSIVCNPKANKNTVVQSVISRLQNLLRLENFQIDQPIMMVDIINIIINTPDVLSLVDLAVNDIRGTVEDRMYSDISFNIDANTYRGMVMGPPGSIFELKYPEHDIIGTAA